MDGYNVQIAGEDKMNIDMTAVFVTGELILRFRDMYFLDMVGFSVVR